VPLVGWPSLVRKPGSEPHSPSRIARRRPRLLGTLSGPLSGHARTARALGYMALFGLSAFLVACSGKLPTGNEPGPEPPPGITPVAPVTEAGHATMNLYLITLVIAAIVFLIVEGLLVFITIRFRRKPGDETLPKQVHGSNPLEILWTLIPAITVTALFIGAFITLSEQEVQAANPAVTVDVTGFQWQWTFEYADQGIKLTGAGRDGPVMALPVGENVHIRLHAADVIHSFYVPQALYKKDVVPGRTNEFDIRFDQAGTYAGQCAEFCGIGHADMHFSVQAMARTDFDAWVTQQQQQASAPPASQAAPPPGAASIQVAAIGITQGFNPNTLTAPANQPFTVQFTNSDPSVPHNFSIHKANQDGTDWVAPVNADGGQSATYNPPPLAPGDYQFYCSIHPNMVGTLHVQ
jgi:cytochrome c oxidase subunit II